MLKYIFGAIFVLLAWAVVLVFHELVPMWPAIVVTLFVVLGFVALAVFRAFQGKRAARQIEQALADQARDQAGSVRPEMQAQIAAMQAEFNKAVGSLKSSKLAKGGGRDALGVLPWYVIIGPPGSGKTTALEKSGLKFPHAVGGGKAKLKGVGGTRNCDWWLTNEAIILDTAGRWSVEDDDRDEWHAFLDLLKRTRPGKPVNGIFLAVSVTDLHGEDDPIEDLGAKLRERIDEVCKRLEMVVPVYLLVTKCDLIPGFVESFADIRDKELRQVWGFTLPLMATGEDRNAQVEEKLGELRDVIEARSWTRLGEERRVEARQQMYEFPQQLGAITENLRELVSVVFNDSVYEDAPIMRGIYFTSGTQEGRPIDRIKSEMARAFGTRPKALQAPPITKPKSYFVHDVFRMIAFPDRDVAVRSSRVLRKQKMTRIGVTAGAFAVALGFLLLPLSAFFENRTLVSESSAFVTHLGEMREAQRGRAGLPARDATAGIEAMGPMAAKLLQIETEGPGLMRRFGLYPGERLLAPVASAVGRFLLAPILEEDGKEMQAFLRGQGKADVAGIVDALTLHLLATAPKGPDEPTPPDETWRQKWSGTLGDKAAASWARHADTAASTKAKTAVANAARFYALRVLDPADLSERNTALVGRLRTTILGTGNADPVADLINDPSMPRDLRLLDLARGSITAFKDSDSERGPSVPGAFTPDGMVVVKKRLDLMADEDQAAEDAWILGQRKKREKSEIDSLQSAYFRRYVDTWKNFLLAVSVKEPKTLEEARTILKSLTMEKPLESIWRSASANLAIKDASPFGAALARAQSALDQRVKAVKKQFLGADAAKGDKPATRRRGDEDAFGPAEVEKEFDSFLKFGLAKPTGLETYHGLLGDLLGALGDAGAPDAKAFSTALKTSKVKFAGLIASYRDTGWEPAVLEKMLMPPLRGAEVAVGGASADSANRKWCETVVTAFDQTLGGRYPFATGKNARDARVADVEKFFAPKSGTLWAYFGEVMAGDIDHPAGTAIFRLKDEAGAPYKPALLSFLKRAQELTDFLFSREPTKMGIGVSVRIHPSPPYSKITFESAGRRVVYFNTKERWEEIIWPGRGAAFKLVEKAGEQLVGYEEGEWALFHLLDDGHAKVASDGEDYLAGTWSPPVGAGAIKVDFKPAGLVSAFRNFDLPRSVVSGAGSCGH